LYALQGQQRANQFDRRDHSERRDVEVYEFAWQMDAILFWDRFNGRWLAARSFTFPSGRSILPSLKLLENWPKFNPRDTR
jgi:hypothetical protein